jgi:DNA-binding NarL/FixJ family response regulator
MNSAAATTADRSSVDTTNPPAAGTSIRVVVADDHQMFREGLLAMLQEQGGIEVLAEAPDGRTAVELAKELHPEVVVMDVTMPDLNGIEATRQIKAKCPGVQVVALSMHADRQFITDMLEAGASGYLLKDCPFSELLASLRAAVAHEVYLSPKIASVVVRTYDAVGVGPGKRLAHKLTPREREILQLVADGGSSKEIAHLLGLSVKTVDTHRRQVMEKLQIYSVAELTHFAIREGLTTLHS